MAILFGAIVGNRLVQIVAGENVLKFDASDFASIILGWATAYFIVHVVLPSM